MQCRECGTSVHSARSDLCIGCAGALQLSQEFRETWHCESLRNLACDIALSAVRQVRALRTFQRKDKEVTEGGLELQEAGKEGGVRPSGSGRPRSPPYPPRKDKEREERRSRSRERGRDRVPEPDEEEYSEEEDEESAESPKVVGKHEKGATSRESLRTTTPKAKAAHRESRHSYSEERNQESGRKGEGKVREEEPKARRKTSADRSYKEEEPRRGYGYRSLPRRDEKEAKETYLPRGLLRIHSNQDEGPWRRRRCRPRRRR